MQSFDVCVFQWIHPTAAPSPTVMWIALGLAEGTPVLTAGLLICAWWLSAGRYRRVVVRAVVFAAIAVLINGLIGLAWDRPRPFVAGVGQAWLAHAATASFPSNHLTLQWVVAGVLLLDRRARPWGIGIALLGLPMAWARVYLGVHYPGDMLGALGVAALAMLGSRWIAGGGVISGFPAVRPYFTRGRDLLRKARTRFARSRDAH
ncbi:MULTISPECIES: phosphatase PAP2 family protein [unclassified Rudaea]|uniref:phosphatase PAP2 family protein n=1 Tax=unclassified Rudaea TaxID=2627037 RepID=UPI0020161FF4|nr:MULTISPECIES: phosphatase PAP2 family protein [unclassified Rudaea]